MLSIKTLDDAKFWATIDPRPVVFYSKKNDAHLVCWNGVLMTHKQALLIASSMFFNVWPNPKMKDSVWSEFVRLYYSNAFETASWNMERFNPAAHYGYLHSKIFFHYESKLKDKYSKIDVLKWFDKKELAIEESV